MDLKDSQLFRQQAFIDGVWLNADNGQTIKVSNPATGEIIYPAANAGTGAVSVATLISRNGQACMQIASDPAADGVVDIDLSPNTLVELPYYLPAEGY